MSQEYETKIVFYDSQGAMSNGVLKMQKDGWEVIDTETIKGNYKLGKTCCLGSLFLPLALLGKGGDQFKVQYKRKLK